jgi:hypothetical protein
MGFTPFFLVYGSEAMLPIDVEYRTPGLKAYNEQNNDATREDALDQLEEARDVALLHSARYQQSLQRYQDKHVRRRDLNVGDLVLWRSQNNKGRHKLTPPWEGPYIIAEVLNPGTYKLSKEKGKIFTNAWNIEQFGSQALIISRRDHLDLEKFCKATPRLLSGLDQVHAGNFILLVRLVWIHDEAISDEAHVILEPRPNDRHDPLHTVM